MPAIRFTTPLAYPQGAKPENYKLMVFKASQLRKEWEKNIFHLAPDHVPADKSKDLERRIRHRKPIAIPIIRIEEGIEPGIEYVDVHDGRNRTAFLIGKGLKEIPAMVKQEQAERFQDLGLARVATPEERKAIAIGSRFPMPEPKESARNTR